jgi:hypothetical protein
VGHVARRASCVCKRRRRLKKDKPLASRQIGGLTVCDASVCVRVRTEERGEEEERQGRGRGRGEERI